MFVYKVCNSKKQEIGTLDLRFECAPNIDTDIAGVNVYKNKEFIEYVLLTKTVHVSKGDTLTIAFRHEDLLTSILNNLEELENDKSVSLWLKLFHDIDYHLTRMQNES